MLYNVVLAIQKVYDTIEAHVGYEMQSVLLNGQLEREEASRSSRPKVGGVRSKTQQRFRLLTCIAGTLSV